MNKEVIMRGIILGIGRFVLAIVQASIIGAMIALPLAASQAPLFNPTSGTLSGLSMVQNQNNANDALATCNAGGSAPSTQFLSGSASNSDCWDDTSTTGWIKHRIWMNGAFVATAFYDLTNALYTGIVGGGAINSVASAATTDLCGGTQYAAYMNISAGTVTAITSFGASCQTGQWKRLNFAAGLTLTYNATALILPTGANITTAAGDTADAIALGSGNWIVTNYQRATGAALSSVGLSVGASSMAQSAQGYASPLNPQLAASVSGNQLTVSVLGVNGSNPSSTNPVLVNFRSQTLANGSNGVVYGQITSALSMTLGTVDSMGCTTAVACRLWVELICQTESAGACSSILLGLSLQSTLTTSSPPGAQIYPLPEDVLQSTGSGTAGGTTAGVIQTSVASLSGKAIRIAGYVEVTWTSGTGWATAPSKLQLFGPGVKKPGDVVQVAYGSTGTTVGWSSGTSGPSSVTASITPTSALNPVLIDATYTAEQPGANSAILGAQIHRGTSPAIGVSQNFGVNTAAFGSGINLFGDGSFSLIDFPATTSATSYTIYGSSSGPNNIDITGGSMRLEEIMGALTPEQMPANDGGAPLQSVG